MVDIGTCCMAFLIGATFAGPLGCVLGITLTNNRKQKQCRERKHGFNPASLRENSWLRAEFEGVEK